MTDLYTFQPERIVFYATSWCADCRRARKIFAEKEIAFLEVDIEADDEAAAFVESLNNGFRSVPTIVFPDGTHLVEPSNERLITQLASL
jgi:mycoredoxin